MKEQRAKSKEESGEWRVESGKWKAEMGKTAFGSGDCGYDRKLMLALGTLGMTASLWGNSP